VTAPALVVGGGIGGLATALSLARSGQRVHLLERAGEFAEIGAGLQFGPNASRALDALGVLDDVLPVAVRPGRAVLVDAVTGDPITTLELGPAFARRYGYPYLVLHRHDLLATLVRHCRDHPSITLETRREVVDVALRPDSAVVTCADGSTYETPALVAADGLHSALRRHVVTDEPVCSGYAAYRGTVPASGTSTDVLLWIGPGIHLMQYPVRRGELYNQVAVFRSPRYLDGHTAPGDWGGPDELDAAFAAACRPVREAVGRIPGVAAGRCTTAHRSAAGRTGHWSSPATPPTRCCSTSGRARARRWRTRSSSATGSAATPARGPSTSRAAYREFEQARLPRTTRCQTSARPWGDLWHTEDPLVLALRDRVLGGRAADDYRELDWLYAPPDPAAPAPAAAGHDRQSVPS
jgi:2-polyprenyl-6-methoxyphenol hydroxylase-like FAD-dependent oxidoreductase